ncbi:type II toxin-antitoxin system VapC family toxin [Candidatus Woesearchaeota archaeon]|nr:type II toxin-antitoxin system VapC family toxin [Candidatus Woesearchaeota archaeon]
MSLILDTSFLIALHSVKDLNHENAKSLKIKLKNKEFGQCFISDYIFDEFVTFLMAKSFPAGTVREIGNVLLAEESIKLLKVDIDIFLQSWELFKKSSSLSFTDCTTIILAKEFGVKNVASYDADFDKISSIKRI